MSRAVVRLACLALGVALVSAYLAYVLDQAPEAFSRAMEVLR